MQMWLKSDNVQKVSVYKCVADYMTAKNPQMEVIHANNSVKLVDNFAFAMRAEDTELKKSVDAAVVAMRQDGTPDNLIKTYITNFNPNEEPPVIAIENFDIESAARAVALTSKTIDISFWAIIPTNEDMLIDVDKSQGVELSEPYFQDEIVHIK